MKKTAVVYGLMTVVMLTCCATAAPQTDSPAVMRTPVTVQELFPEVDTVCDQAAYYEQIGDEEKAARWKEWCNRLFCQSLGRDCCMPPGNTSPCIESRPR